MSEPFRVARQFSADLDAQRTDVYRVETTRLYTQKQARQLADTLNGITEPEVQDRS